MKDMTGKDTSSVWAYARPLSLNEAAEWAGVSPRTIRRLATQGIIGVKATDKFWAFPQHELAMHFLGADAEFNRLPRGESRVA